MLLVFFSDGSGNPSSKRAAFALSGEKYFGEKEISTGPGIIAASVVSTGEST